MHVVFFLTMYVALGNALGYLLFS